MNEDKTLAADNAPAMAGWAVNPNAPVDQRLAAGAQALDFYVDQADRLDDLLDHLTAMRDRDMSDYELMYSRPAYDDAANRLRNILNGRDAEDTFGVVCIKCESRRLKDGACQQCGTIQIRRRGGNQ